MGTFDPTKDDVYTFTDRVYRLATLRGHKLIQNNLSLQLLGAAKTWYEVEMNDVTRRVLCEAPSVQNWVDALILRFKPSPAIILQKLNKAEYTRSDAANQKDPVLFFDEILTLTRHDNRPDYERSTIAYIRFESQLRMTLNAPQNGSTIQDFIDQLEGKKEAWYQAYHNFGKKTTFPSNPAPNQHAYGQRAPGSGQTNPYRPPARPTYPNQRQIINGPPQQPSQQAYWGEEDQNEWVYDPPTDTYHVASAYPATHGPGHTPRRYGNTHDGDYGTEAQANWTAAGEEHRCSHQGCTHYHDQ